MAKGRINIVIAGDASKLNKAMAQSERRMRKFGRNLQSIGDTVFRSIGVPFIAAGAAGVKAAMDFESSMSKIQGLVGVTGSELTELQNAAMELGPRMGKSANEAAEALFYITSAGLRSTDAIDALEASLKASAAGLGETKVIADLVTSAMNAYGAKNLSASKATDILTAAVREGKLEADSLAGSMGRVLPIASAMGVQFEEVGAAMAAMSRTGTNADEAATQLRGIMNSILKPTREAEMVLNEMGLSSEGLRMQIQEKGLLSALETLKANFKGNTAATAAVFGNVRALTGVFDLMGTNVETTREIFKELGVAVGATDNAFEVVSQTAGFKLKKALSELNVAAIKLGAELIPMVTKVADGVADMARAFSSMESESRGAIVSVLKWTTALSLLATIAGRLVIGFANFRGALRQLGLTKFISKLVKFRQAIGGILLPIGLAVQTLETYISFLLKADNAIGDMIRRHFAMDNVAKTMVTTYAELKGALFGYKNEVKETTFDIDKANAAIDEMAIKASEQSELWKSAAKQLKDWTQEQLDEIAAKEKAKKAAEDLLKVQNQIKETTRELYEGIKVLGYEEQLFGENLSESKITAYEVAMRKLLELGLTPASAAVKNLKAELDALYTSLMPKVERLQKIQSGPERFGTPDSLGGESDPLRGVSLMGVDTTFNELLERGNKGLEERNDLLNNMADMQRVAADAGQTLGEQIAQLAVTGQLSFQKLAQAVIEAAGKIVRANLITAVTNYITSAFQNFGIWGTVLAAGAGAVVGGLFDAAAANIAGKKVPALAEGGVAFGPTMAMVGDNSGARVNPEVIAPLDKLKSMMGGNNVNVSGQFRIRGTDLVVALERTNRQVVSERGYGLNE